MSLKPLEFGPLAIREVRAARKWYEDISPDLASRFVQAFRKALDRIESSAEACPPYFHGTRFAKVGRFPYVIVFFEFEDKLVVIAVAHVRRKPGYSRKRKS